MVELSKLALLARGGQADIYEYGAGKVLRVLRGARDRDLLKNEMAVMKELRDSVDVPEVYEYMEIEGRPAAVVERIDGHSMMDDLRLTTIVRVPRELAAMHLRIGETRVAYDLPAQRSNVLIEQSAHLSRELKDFAYELIAELPKGEDLCHGDFHPGNILRCGAKDYIIDWFGVYRGDILSDVAHSYLLMRNVPRLPHLTDLQFRLMKLAGKYLSGRYVGAIRRLHPFDWGIFSKWLAVKAAERTLSGLPSQKERLASFIRTCYEMRKKGIPPEKWYRKL